MFDVENSMCVKLTSTTFGSGQEKGPSDTTKVSQNFGQVGNMGERALGIEVGGPEPW